MVLLGLAAFVLTTGCGFIATMPIMERPEVTKLEMAQKKPISGKTMVGFYQIGYNRDRLNENKPEGEYYWVPEFEIEKETGELAKITNSINLFDVVLKSRLTLGEATRSKLIGEARKRGFDFLLLPQVTDYKVRFVGNAGTHVGNIFLWFALWVPSWFVHDEIYAADVSVKMTLVDVYSQKDIIRKTYSGTKEMRLNSFQRGWKFFSVWRGPGSHAAQNWQKVATNLMPKALNNLKVSFLQDFKQGVVKAVTEKDAFRRAAAKIVVLGVGVSKYASGKISPIPYAAHDAADFFNNLRREGKAPKAYSTLLLNGMGAKKDILNNLAALSKHTRDSDTLVFYFSGYGAALSSGKSVEYYLIPHDVLPGRIPETAVSLREIGNIVKKSKAGEVIVILETSFGSNNAGKSLKASNIVNQKAITDMLGNRTAVFSACQGNQPANIFQELKNGLFTYFIMESLKKGDSNKDGLVTMKEAFMYTREKVKATSQFRGRIQEPHWEGLTDLRFILKGSDKENAIKSVLTQLGAESVEEVKME